MKVGDMVRHIGNTDIQFRLIPKTDIEVDIPPKKEILLELVKRKGIRSYAPSLSIVYPKFGVIVEVRERLIKVYWNDSIGTILHPRTSLEVISESR